MENASYFEKQHQNDLRMHYLGRTVHFNGRLTIEKRSVFTKFLHINVFVDRCRVGFFSRIFARCTTGNVVNVL